VVRARRTPHHIHHVFGVALFCLFKFLKEPLQWWLINRGLNEEQSAKVIGNYLPNVKDGLLNLIQLAASGKTQP
jgi:hypothetical protein